MILKDKIKIYNLKSGERANLRFESTYIFEDGREIPTLDLPKSLSKDSGIKKIKFISKPKNSKCFKEFIVEENRKKEKNRIIKYDVSKLEETEYLENEIKNREILC